MVRMVIRQSFFSSGRTCICRISLIESSYVKVGGYVSFCVGHATVVLKWDFNLG